MENKSQEEAPLKKKMLVFCYNIPFLRPENRTAQLLFKSEKKKGKNNGEILVSLKKKVILLYQFCTFSRTKKSPRCPGEIDAFCVSQATRHCVPSMDDLHSVYPGKECLREQNSIVSFWATASAYAGTIVQGCGKKGRLRKHFDSAQPLPVSRGCSLMLRFDSKSLSIGNSQGEAWFWSKAQSCLKSSQPELGVSAGRQNKGKKEENRFNLWGKSVPEDSAGDRVPGIWAGVWEEAPVWQGDDSQREQIPTAHGDQGKAVVCRQTTTLSLYLGLIAAAPNLLGGPGMGASHA